MPADPPASLLITPDLRRRLQQRYEEALRLKNHQPPQHARIHELLAECLRADPGNTLYLEALLANVRKWQPRKGSGIPGWLTGWISSRSGESPAGGERTEYSVLSTQYLADHPIDETVAREALRNSPDLILSGCDDANTFVSLAAACAAFDLDQAAVRHLRLASESAPDDAAVARMLARALTRQGHFDEAAAHWQRLVAIAPDAEAQQALDDLQVPSDLESSDRQLAEASAAGGEDLALRRERENLRLAHIEQQVATARQRARHDPHPKAQALAAALAAELLRQEIEILHLRSERLPGDRQLRLDLARKLKQVGNYSGAIQRLEEVRGDPALAAEVLLELGECWQHLRQFERALDFYRQAVAAAETIDEQREPRPLVAALISQQEPRPLVAALYRTGVLAAAMGKPDEARGAFARVIALDPAYKDARERLDNLPPN
ncbi:MAG TPA: tetratricopeptide repeat protein [Pirellulaceae bacterium]|nr:tetratricopeptide repeat protein [Pirellulaceae bacterium]